MATNSQARWNIQVEGADRLLKKLQILGENDAPFLREALEAGGELMKDAASGRAPGSMASKFQGPKVRTYSGSLRALVEVKHPGARSMEFGRFHYYRGYSGRAVKATGTRFKSSPGQKAQPMFGIVKGDAAVGAVGGRVKELLERAITAEWEKLT